MRQQDSWTNLHELLAAAVEALWAILGRLEGGIGVVNTKTTRKPTDRGRYPRPAWLTEHEQAAGDDDVLVVRNVGEAIRIMRGGRDGS